MKGKIADRERGFGLISILLICYGVVCIVTFVFHVVLFPFLVIGLFTIFAGIYILIPYEYIDDDEVKGAGHERKMTHI